MKFRICENSFFLNPLTAPVLFFSFYFFPSCSFFITFPVFTCFFIKLRHLPKVRVKILLFFFLSISGAAIFQRDILFSEYKNLNTVSTPEFVEAYKIKLFQITNNLKNSEFLSALATGKRVFSYSFRKDLINTGTMHIVAISAMHVGLMVIYINYFLKLISSILSIRPRYFLMFSFILKILFSYYYFFITGASVPTLRALFFILFFDFFIMTGIYPYIVSLFIFSLMSVCIFIPSSTTSISFIMSALCVATIIKIWKLLPDSITIKMISTSIILNYILLPVSSDLNSSYSLSAPLVNLLVIPVVSLAIPFITLSQFIISVSDTIAEFSLIIADKLTSPATFSITFFGNFAEMSSFPIINPPFAIKLIFIFSFFCALFYHGRIKLLFIPLNIIFLLPFYFNLQLNEFKIIRPAAFFGKAVCITYPMSNGSILFDKFNYNPEINDRFIQRLEKASGECGISKIISIHLPKEISGEKEAIIKKRIRSNSTEIYFFNESVFHERNLNGVSSYQDYDHIP